MQHIIEFKRIGPQVEVAKDHFVNNEILPHGVTHFKCGTCKSKINLKITPYGFGFPFSEIQSTSFLEKKSILALKMATPASKWALHLGELLVHDLPTLYAIIECEQCHTNHLVVFGCGESQPGKFLCQISGVWVVVK